VEQVTADGRRPRGGPSRAASLPLCKTHPGRTYSPPRTCARSCRCPAPSSSSSSAPASCRQPRSAGAMGGRCPNQRSRPGSTRDMPTPGPGSCPTRPPLPACGTDALEAPPVNTRLLTGPTHGPGTSRLPAWAADRRPETGPPLQQWPHQPAEAMVDDPSEATSCGHQPPTGSARRRDPHRPERAWP